MRILVTALLAFAAGMALMLLLERPPTTHPLPAATIPTPAATAPAPASSQVAAASTVADDADGDDWPDRGPTPEQVIYDQQSLVRRALAGLGPRVKGRPNLYLVAFAGDGGEDVFRNEAEYAALLFRKRFGPSVHALVLENNPATLQNHPLADWSNLESVLDGLAAAMRPDDILMLYFTSHGSDDHYLLVDMDPLPLDQIGARDLPGILAEHRFKWKVVVVNACYSGGFVPPLQGPDTLVMSAASADRSSFGCGSESQITYFGDAFLNHALNDTDDFVQAFHQASGLIAGWENRDHLPHSRPQISVGSGIAGQLARWRQGIRPGPPVAFRATAPR